MVPEVPVLMGYRVPIALVPSTTAVGPDSVIRRRNQVFGDLRDLKLSRAGRSDLGKGNEREKDEYENPKPASGSKDHN